MNFGMPPGAGGGPSNPGSSAGVPPAGQVAPPNAQQQQQQRIQQQHNMRTAHQQRTQQINGLYQNGQINAHQHQYMLQQCNTQFSHMWEQQFPQFPPIGGMPMPRDGGGMSAADRKKNAAYMAEMQKRNAAAVAGQNPNHMMMANQMRAVGGVAYPPGSSAAPAVNPAIMQQRMQAMHPNAVAAQQQQQQQQVQISAAQQVSSLTPQYPNPQSHGGPPSVQSVNITNPSPQLMQNMQPPTPQQGGPPSIPAPGSNPPFIETEQQNVEYMTLLKEMKATYLDKIRSIDERCNINRSPKPKGIVQMLEILEEKRRVPISVLEKVKPSLAILVSRECVTFTLMEEIRKSLFDKEEREKLSMSQISGESAVIVDEKHGTLPTSSKHLFYEECDGECRTQTYNEEEEEEEAEDHENCLLDPWRSVRHMRIRVPQVVRTKMRERLIEEDMLVEKRRKRKMVEEEDERLESEPVKKAKVKNEEGYEVNCVFDPRQPWEIPPEARTELYNIRGWTIDEQCLPTCSTSPYITISVKTQRLLCPPLRIALPMKYPQEPAYVQFDRTFPPSTIGGKLQQLFEKWLGTRSSARTITDFYEAFNAACEEFLVYKQSGTMLNGKTFEVINDVTVPITAPEYDAVVIPANNKTNKIAHKGMVA